MSRLFKVADACSQLANVALLPRVEDTTANESISGRAYREGWRIRLYINALFFWQDDHCRAAYLKDLDRAREYLEDANARI